MRMELAFVMLVFATVSVSTLAAQRPYLRSEEEMKALRSSRSAEAREKALVKWARYVERNDEETWALVPGSTMFRAIHVNRVEGCPNCGRKAFEAGGYYPFRFDFFGMPWKVRCPSCAELFPKNDFYEFYLSGLGPDGLFDPARADRRLLFNTEHPDPNEPQHLYGVDDGRGYIDKEGHEYHFVAYYCFKWWQQISRDVASMAQEYLRAGEPQLAHKAAVLLARMADVYPGMDHFTQGYHYATGKLGGEPGKAICACWEPNRLRQVARAYDDVWDIFGGDAALVEFLTAKAKQCGHPEWAGSAAALRSHIEQDLLAEGARVMMEDRAEPQVRGLHYGGDEGDVQYTVALLGAVIDGAATRRQLLEWPFAAPRATRGGLHEVFSGPIIGREGAGGASSPAYSAIHYRMARQLADLYLGIEGPEHRNLYSEYPCIRKSYESQFAFNCCERYSPHIGDCDDSTGAPSGLGRFAYRLCSADTMLEAFHKFQDVRYSQMAYFFNHHSTKGFPARTAQEVAAIVKEHGEIELRSTNLNGYGLAVLRSGTGPAERQRAAWLYYGCAVVNSHTHYDRLNIGLFAKGLNLMPDLGYPERCGGWPKRSGWTNNTVSHNTVVVDAARQKKVTVGDMNLFCRSPLVRLIDVSKEPVYPQTSLYRRVYAMIDISGQDSYLVDIFRVKGGKDHHYSFHSAEGDVSTQGLSLVEQPTGTLAGPDIEFGDADYRKTSTSGFHYLRNIERDTAPPERWSVEWQIKDTWNVFGNGHRAPTDVRLRLTMLGNHAEVILADGEPPILGRPKNPQSLKYLLVHNTGDDLASVYASVTEPYQGARNLKRIRRLPMEPAADDVEGMDAVAIEIEHTSGVVDYVLSAHDASVTRKVGDIEFAGQWGFVRTRDGNTEYAYLVAGTLLSGSDFKLELSVAHHEGVITDMDREMDEHNCIYTDAELPEDDTLVGSWLRVSNRRGRELWDGNALVAGGQDACYDIKQVRRENGRMVVDLGDITFIRCVKDPKDYEAGYTYNFEVGDRFAIPTAAVFNSETRARGGK